MRNPDIFRGLLHDGVVQCVVERHVLRAALIVTSEEKDVARVAQWNRNAVAWIYFWRVS